MSTFKDQVFTFGHPTHVYSFSAIDGFKEAFAIEAF